jgi:hypothetical protein
MCAVPLFWTIPPAFLQRPTRRRHRAHQCHGQLSGASVQVMVGAIKSATGSLYMAFDVIGGRAGARRRGAAGLHPARQLHDRTLARRAPTRSDERAAGVTLAAISSPSTEAAR